MPDQALINNLSAQKFIDKHERKISYLRISVTDRCNFTCLYCRSENDYIHHNNILRFEEIERCINIFAQNGIEKIRFTGGEPFVRKGFIDFLTRVHEKHPHLELCVTTNGTFDTSIIPNLKQAQVRINLSLDSFNKENFKKITGQDCFEKVIENAYALLQAGIKLKINAVAMKNINSQEIAAFIDFARKNKADVRFIEFMPMGEDTKWEKDIFWPASDILLEASQHAKLIEVESISKNSGPAKMFTIENGLGRFGVITPLSSHFCNSCNRLRLTSNGYLRTCLFDDYEFALKDMLANKELSDSELTKYIQNATEKKQIGASIVEQRKEERNGLITSNKEIAKKKMVDIGG